MEDKQSVLLIAKVNVVIKGKRIIFDNKELLDSPCCIINSKREVFV